MLSTQNAKKGLHDTHVLSGVLNTRRPDHIHGTHTQDTLGIYLLYLPSITLGLKAANKNSNWISMACRVASKMFRRAQSSFLGSSSRSFNRLPEPIRETCPCTKTDFTWSVASKNANNADYNFVLEWVCCLDQLDRLDSVIPSTHVSVTSSEIYSLLISIFVSPHQTDYANLGSSAWAIAWLLCKCSISKSLG